MQANDGLLGLYEATTADDLVLFFASGHYAIINLNLLPVGLQKGLGVNVDQFLKDYASQVIVGCLVVKNRDYQALKDLKLCFVSAKGMGKIVIGSQLQALKQDRLLKAMKFKVANDQLISVQVILKPHYQLSLLTQQQLILRIDSSQIVTQSLSGSGLLLIKLKGNDQVISALVHSAKKPLICKDQKGKIINLNSGGQIPKANRATQGSKHFLKNLNLKDPIVAIAHPDQLDLIKS